MLEINVPGDTYSPITLSPTVAPSMELIPTEVSKYILLFPVPWSLSTLTIGSGDAKEGSLGLNIVLRPSVVLVETPIVPELSPESEPIPAAI